MRNTDETSATPDLTARSNHKNYNNQTTMKHQSGTRKVKDSQTKANRGLSRSWPFHIMLNRKVKPVNRGYAEQAFSNQKNKGTPLGGLD